MDHNSIFPSTLFARFISIHPDKQDINFPSQTNEDQTTAEWRIYQSPNGEIFIKNISASYLQVDDIILETSQEKRLFGGERLSFGQDSGLKFDYVFCFMNLQSDLKRGRDDEIIDSEKMKKLVKIENDLPKELTCSICTTFLHKCMTLAPCQYSFCSFCLFDHLQLSSQCPLCRTEAASVAKNPVLLNVVQLVEDSFSIQQRSQEGKELEEISFGGAILRNSIGVYIGSYVNRKRDGQGKMIYKDGSIYEGYWKNDKAEGKGAVILKSGEHYDGYWMNHRRHGIGRCTWSFGKEYEGKFQDDSITGFGTIKYEDGRIYQGQWKNSTKEGYGILTLPNGDKYEGKWQDDVLQAEVKVEYSNGEKYEGEIDINDFKKQGKGVLILKSGDKYQGSWANNILQPEVKIAYSNGEKYEGEISVENLKRQGKGILTFKNGNKFQGTWANDVLQSAVAIEYSNGDKYEGEINVENMQKQGKGVLITNDGDQYDGDWVNDKQSGCGKYIWKGNKFIYEGLWSEGKLTGDGVMTYMDSSGFQANWNKFEKEEDRSERKERNR